MVFSGRMFRMGQDKHDAEEAPVHNFSLETPEFFDDIYLRLTSAETPRSRLIYPIQAPNGTVCRVLTRGR